ncbi:MAG TPA: hypothetical protein VNR64_00535 [Vicinamibacterales bacterium]|nr:hypothetical protein [Vicinamibacterales bacterium]
MLIRFALPIVIALAAMPHAPQTRHAVDLEAADCSHYQSMWGDFRTAYGTQRTTVPVSVGTLEVRPEDNGGVQVLRGNGSAYSITACIAAGARTVEDAQQAVDAVRIVVDGVRVTTSGASRARRVSVQLVVEAPRDARIRATTSNGPIGFEDVDGTFSADASNGPIALHNVHGTVNARTQNGPISIHGGGGTFDAEASNGPISVTLEGTRWNGRLDARSHNGPLTVTVPPDFVSGVEISSSSRSPWNCRLAECRTSNGDRDYDSSRSLRLGRDPVVVRITTNNGPVAVQER